LKAVTRELAKCKLQWEYRRADGTRVTLNRQMIVQFFYRSGTISFVHIVLSIDNDAMVKRVLLVTCGDVIVLNVRASHEDESDGMILCGTRMCILSVS
jgi:hypothetical protein